MYLREMKAELEDYAQEIDAAMRQLVTQAEKTQAMDLYAYSMLSSLATLMVAADAVCTSAIEHSVKKGVPV